MHNFLLSEKKLDPYSQFDKDINCFEMIYNRYVGKVYHKCLIMTKDAEAAQDFTQDIFIKVYAKLNTFQNRSTFATWLYSITHNYCLDQIRLSKRISTELLSESITEKLMDSDQSANSQWHMLECMMSDLSSQEVAFLKLKYEEGLSVKAISEQYQLSESAVKMRLMRTRNKLQNLYVTIYNN